ncbi:MAG: hypothetical protein AAFU41_09310 [Pseudomonadota bacterium]
MRNWMILTALAVLPLAANAQSCAPLAVDPMEGFAPLDPLTYLDLPDPDGVRVTAPIEGTLYNSVLGQEAGRLTKRYCAIGIQDMVVEFEVSLLDDALAGQVTRAVYVWNSAGDPVGWQLDALGERFRCARGDDPWAALCP